MYTPGAALVVIFCEKYMRGLKHIMWHHRTTLSVKSCHRTYTQRKSSTLQDTHSVVTYRT